MRVLTIRVSTAIHLHSLKKQKKCRSKYFVECSEHVQGKKISGTGEIKKIPETFGKNDGLLDGSLTSVAVFTERSCYSSSYTT